MGFKHVTIKELETSLSSNFIGMPLTHIEELAGVRQDIKIEQVSTIEIVSEVSLKAEETLEYTYSIDGHLNSFNGTGMIATINTSKKDRIWDIRMKLSGLENTNLKSNEIIKLGNFEPQTNKKLNYNLFNHENLIEPLKITEEIKVLNIEIEQFQDIEKGQVNLITDPFKKDVEDISSELKEEYSVEVDVKEEKEIQEEKREIDQKEMKSEDFESFIKKQVDEDFEPQINNIEAKLQDEQVNLNEVEGKSAEWKSKSKELNATLKTLKKELKILTKSKAKALSKKIKGITGDKKEKKLIIKSISLNGEKESTPENLNELDSQISNIESQLKATQASLDDAIKEVNEWSTKQKEHITNVNQFKNELRTLIKTKNRTLIAKLKEISKEKRIKIEEVKAEIKKKKKIDSVSLPEGADDDKLEEQFKSLESKLRVALNDLDDTSNKISDWTNKKQDLNINIKILKKHLKTLIKSKSKAPIESEVFSEVDSQIVDIESKLENNKALLDELIKNVSERDLKKKELIDIIKTLKNQLETLVKTKNLTLNSRLKEISLKKIKNEIIDIDTDLKKKEIENEFNLQINSVSSKLSNEQNNLSKAKNELNECSARKVELIDKLKTFKNELQTLQKAKSKTLRVRLKELTKEEIKKKAEEFDTPLIDVKNNIRNQINEKVEEIGKIQEDASIQKSDAEKEINDQFAPQVNGMESKLANEQANLDDAVKNKDGCTIKKNNLDETIKNLENELKNITNAKSIALKTRLKVLSDEMTDGITVEEKLKKEAIVKKEVDDELDPQINSIRSKLENEQMKLDEISEKAAEWTSKVKNLNEIVKTLNKEQKNLIKEKSKVLNAKVKKINIIKVDKIKAIRSKIRLNENEIKEAEKKYSTGEAFLEREIEAEFNPKIESLESKIAVEQNNLENAIKSSTEWNAKVNKLNITIKALKKEYKNLSKAKSKALINNMKEFSKENSEEILIKTEKEKSMKEVSVKKEIDNEFNPQISEIESKLKIEEKILDELIRSISEASTKKEELDTTIKNLKNELSALKKEKSKALKKSRSIKQEDREVENEFDIQINDINSKLKGMEKDLENSIKKLGEWTEKEKELKSTTKSLKRELNTFSKVRSKPLVSKFNEDDIQDGVLEEEITKTEEEFSKKEVMIKKEIDDEFDIQINDIESKLNNEQANLNKGLENHSKWTEKKNDLRNQIETLIKAKNKLFDRKRNKEFLNKGESTKKEISHEFDPKIESLEFKIAVEQKNLEGIASKIDEWDLKEKEIKSTIKALKKEQKTIIKTKSKTLSERLKKKSENEKETRKKQLSGKEKSALKRDRLIEFEFEETDSEHEPLEDETEKPRKDEIILEAKEEEHVESKFVETEIKNNLILLFNNKNTVQFKISLKNMSEYTMSKIRLGKILSEDFYNFKYESTSNSKIELKKGVIYCSIKDLKSGEKIELNIFAEIYPKEKKVIRTGRIQGSYLFEDNLISGLDIEDFSGYSHAMHAISKKENETQPNIWNCSLLFKNDSDFAMELRSIIVLDKEKQKKYIDLEFNSESNKKIISPGDTFVTEEWIIKDISEPKFYRKLKYSITKKFEKNTQTTLKFDDTVFNMIDLHVSKRFSESELKSYEEAKIENYINIKNIGTIQVKGILIKEVLPADFIPPLNLSDFNVRTSSGAYNVENLKVKVSPRDDDPIKQHVIELFINLDSKSSDQLIGVVDDFIEIRYPFNAITPTYNKKYTFPIEVTSYYPIIQNDEKIIENVFYKIKDILNPSELPEIKVVHKRRNLLISKEIFPGRNVDEFGISIIIRNNSNVEVKDVTINDTISKSFEIISSNREHTISETEQGNAIYFIIDSILSYQETEVRYYVKKKSEVDIDYDELESFIFG